MDRSKIEKAVKMGVTLAAGKPLDEAIATVMECLDLVLPAEPTSEYRPDPKAEQGHASTPAMGEAGLRAAIPPKPLRDLKPIDDDAPQILSKKTRIYWSIEDLQAKVLEEAPVNMPTTVNGSNITLRRITTTIDGMPPGVQLGYAPGTVTSATPYPKLTFWANEENIDVMAAYEKLVEEVPKYFGYATKNVPPSVVRDVPIRFAVGTESMD